MRNGIHMLIIDDEEAVRDSMSQVLVKEGYAAKVAETGREGMALFSRETFEVVFLDLRLPDIDGLSLLRQMREASQETPVVIITAYGSIESAVEAIKLGAFEYLAKPFTPEELRVVTQKALANRMMILENILLRRELKARREFDQVVGQSQAMRNVLDIVARAGPTDSAVLITGESGTGKELVAREIHGRSLRHSQPFVTVDCGALVEPLLEDELFGHAKGALAGARETKHGRFELANGGTIFFNEIAHLSLPSQSKVFRAIQEREVTRLGSARPIKIGIRMIASSSANIAQAVNHGAFREDLFYRLSVVPIHLPPLRDRKEDIPPLVDYFLQKYGRRAAKTISGVSNRAMLALSEYDWPGNIRELENTIERAVALCRGSEIEMEDIVSHGISMGIPALTWAGGQFKTLSDIEREYIKAVLRDQEGNRSRAATILGINRKTLWAKIKKYGLEGRDFK